MIVMTICLIFKLLKVMNRLEFRNIYVSESPHAVMPKVDDPCYFSTERVMDGGRLVSRSVILKDIPEQRYSELRFSDTFVENKLALGVNESSVTLSMSNLEMYDVVSDVINSKSSK